MSDKFLSPVCEGCEGGWVNRGRWAQTEWWSCSTCDADEPHKCRLLELEDEVHRADDDFFGADYFGKP